MLQQIIQEYLADTHPKWNLRKAFQDDLLKIIHQSDHNDCLHTSIYIEPDIHHIAHCQQTYWDTYTIHTILPLIDKIITEVEKTKHLA